MIDETGKPIVIEGCSLCDGKGYFEYKTGIVSSHIPYEEEIAKEPCDCVLEQLEMRGNT